MSITVNFQAVPNDPLKGRFVVTGRKRAIQGQHHFDNIDTAKKAGSILSARLLANASIIKDISLSHDNGQDVIEITLQDGRNWDAPLSPNSKNITSAFIQNTLQTRINEGISLVGGTLVAAFTSHLEKNQPEKVKADGGTVEVFGWDEDTNTVTAEFKGACGSCVHGKDSERQTINSVLSRLQEVKPNVKIQALMRKYG